MNTELILYIAVMAGVTYIIRMLPIMVFRRKNPVEACAEFSLLCTLCGAWCNDDSGGVLFDRKYDLSLCRTDYGVCTCIFQPFAYNSCFGGKRSSLYCPARSGNDKYITPIFPFLKTLICRVDGGSYFNFSAEDCTSC